ncbi:Abi family protein [Rugamonas aquatica]|uniref:Abi family protein n=1 Tax=Rugamonas aquatica TaxID=2743357 RepID=A0A6A7N6K4_9BURK|nr:Abi family protein [Rugamonas aquatica]MQA40666.1 hypothetical protein [Rugamonas aquatica]
MHHLVPLQLNDVLEDLSTARLSSYVNFFNTTSNEELYGLYCWNDAVSSRFMRLIGIVEIILRNRFHVALSQEYWNPTLSKGSQDSNDWFLKLYRPYASYSQQNEGDKSIKKKLGPPHNQATPAKVISGMTYGFWPRVLDAQVTVTGAPVPWNILIPKIVPGHHQRAATYWGVPAHQDALFARITLVGDLRNRVAHFEPLWKFKPETEEARERGGVKPRVIQPAPTTEHEVMVRMKKSYDRTTQLLRWLSKSRAEDYMRSENHQALTWLMSLPALDHFKSLPLHREVRLGSLARNWDLKAQLRAGRFLLVTDKGERVGRYYAEPC